ncbi:MAG TPA: amidophosphoribosyltransferase, partial [Accumulibacter sp.]|nr:amidophosphoribosyltransferase [Accumulibacter sp.]
GADALVYQDLAALEASIRDLKPSMQHFDTSCFNGCYVTGDVTVDYLSAIEAARDDHHVSSKDDRRASRQLQLNLMSAN